MRLLWLTRADYGAIVSYMKTSIREANRPAMRADWHPADIVAAVRKTGWSLRQLSLRDSAYEGLCRSALGRQYPRAERTIADAIAVEPWDIWPSRYDDDHQPIRAYSKSSTPRRGRNENAGAAAQS